MENILSHSREQVYEDFESAAEYAEDVLLYDVYLCDVCAGLCDFTNRMILISSRLGVEKRLYILLHEIGHVLIRQNWKKFERDYSDHAGVAQDGRKNKTSKFKISTIEEEIEAWKKAKKVAKKLNIKIDEKKFSQFKTKSLMSYINWAAEE